MLAGKSGGQRTGNYTIIRHTTPYTVSIVERSLLPMETKRENTAVINATSRTASVRNPAIIPKSRFAAERDYRISRILFKSMLNAGLITNEEFVAVDTKLREKYNPISGSLFR